MSIFRIYEPHELGGDGYPLVWHAVSRYPDEDVRGVKHLVREQAGHRCVRCLHPYVVGESGSWDEGASHPPEANGGLDERGESLGWASEAFWPEEEQIDPGDVIRGRRVHWSQCDERCVHGGPLRLRIVTGDVAWEDEYESPGPPSRYIDAGCTVEAAWRILTVHHLNGRKHDLRWWNLIAACQRCHLYVQRKVQMERVYPWEHSAWFKPYAAGWYAYAYLGKDLSREQTMERLDELLGLERVA